MSRKLRYILVFLAANAGAIAMAAVSSPKTPPKIPNDPLFNRQWNLVNTGDQTVEIDLDADHTVLQKGIAGVDIGWEQSRISVDQRAQAPVIVAVIDSGIDPHHPDLQGRIATKSGGASEPILDGWDFIKNSADLSDPTLDGTTVGYVSDLPGHGTHVAGIIAASADNAVGIAGVAPQSVKILPIRVLSDGYVNLAFNNKLISDYAADAVRFAIDHHASVINMSFGWPKFVDTANARDAIQSAIQKGIAVVVSAGNDHQNQPTYPCAYPGVICVGAVTNTGALALYSDFGGLVDALAPGDDIVSLHPIQLESKLLRIQGYERRSGTSQATPHIAAIAAILRSVFPAISLNELKARIFAAASASSDPKAALYGMPKIQAALDATPRPVYYPDFKKMDEIAVDEGTLQAQGSLQITNLWQTATQVQAKIIVNGTPAGSAQIRTLSAGQSFSIPWTYKFASLDSSSLIVLTAQVTDASVKTQVFSIEVPVGRDTARITGQKILSIPTDAFGKSPDWIGTNNYGQLYSTLKAIDAYPAEIGTPRFYKQLTRTQDGSTVQIFDPSLSPSVQTIPVPGIQLVTEIIRMDPDGGNNRDWVILGASQIDGKVYFRFYFLAPGFSPLWGAASTWQIQLDHGNFGDAIIRNYSTPNSWIRGKDHLLPAFVMQGTLPEPDNYNEFDPRHTRAGTHLYYLSPATNGNASASAGGSLALEVRAVDGAQFRERNSDLTLISPAPQTSDDQKAGRVRFFASNDYPLGLNSSIQILDVHSVQTTALLPGTGWNLLSVSGGQVNALPGSSTALVNFYDGTTGSVTWTDEALRPSAQIDFAYRQSQNPITDMLGALDLPGIGRFWFMESAFDLVGFRSRDSAPPQTRTISVQRNTTLLQKQFSELFTPTLVGTTSRPVPGVYIDSTLIRGDQVAVAAWDPSTGVFDKPLRYSLQIPKGCLEMNPVHLDARPESFTLPLLCRNGSALEFRLVSPGTDR